MKLVDEVLQFGKVPNAPCGVERTLHTWRSLLVL